MNLRCLPFLANTGGLDACYPVGADVGDLFNCYDVSEIPWATKNSGIGFAGSWRTGSNWVGSTALDTFSSYAISGAPGNVGEGFAGSWRTNANLHDVMFYDNFEHQDFVGAGWTTGVWTGTSYDIFASWDKSSALTTDTRWVGTRIIPNGWLTALGGNSAMCVIITHLARWDVPGNTGSVPIGIYNAGTAVSETTSVALSGTDTWAWVALTNPVVVTTDTAIVYIATKETSGGNQYWSPSSPVITPPMNSGVTISGVFNTSTSSTIPTSFSTGAGLSYGPINFRFYAYRV